MTSAGQTIADQQYVLYLIEAELDQAQRRFPKFNTAHEGYAILLEEVDELWTEVKKQPNIRDANRLRAEAIQVAAMAARFVLDLCRP